MAASMKQGLIEPWQRSATVDQFRDSVTVEFHDFYANVPLVKILPVFGEAWSQVLHGCIITCAIVWFARMAILKPQWWTDICWNMPFGAVGFFTPVLLSLWLLQFALASFLSLMFAFHFKRNKDFLALVQTVRYDPHKKEELKPRMRWTDAHKEEELKTGLRYTALLYCLLFLVLCIACPLVTWLCGMPCIMLTVLYPISYALWVMNYSGILINTMQKLSDYDVEMFQKKLQADSGQDWNTAEFWRKMTGDHQDSALLAARAWRAVAPLLALFLANYYVLTLVFLTLGMIANRAKHPLASSLTFCMAAFVCILGIVLLVPLALVTSKWQDPSLLTNSVHTLAKKFARLQMCTEARVEYISFSQYLDRSPVGVMMPIIGTISYTFLSKKVMLVFTILPAVLTWTSGLLEAS